MKVKLSGLDRIQIPIILDKAIPESDGDMMVVVAEITDRTVMQPKEIEEYGLQQSLNGGIIWNPDTIDGEKDFELNKYHVRILKDAAILLNENKLVTRRTVKTWKKLKELTYVESPSNK